MAGYIKKMPNGTYRVCLELGIGIDGKRLRKYITKNTSTEAKRVLNEYNNQMYKGTFVEPNKTTLGEWIKYWEENYVKNNCEETTYTAYKQIDDKYIIPCIGHIPLQSLTQIMLDNYYKYLHEEVELTVNTIEKHHANISSALKFAMKKQKVYQNVATLATLPKPKKEEYFEGQTYNIKQAMKLLDYCQKNNKYTEIRCPIALAMFLGMSRGEICGLTLDKIFLFDDDDDENKNYLIIDETRVKNGTKIIVKDPKAKGRKRALYIPHVLKNILKQQLIWIEQDKSVYGDLFVNSRYLCVKDNGEPYNPQYITRRFKQLLEEHQKEIEKVNKDLPEDKKIHNDLPIIRFHDLRHTNITVLIEEDSNIYDVSKHAGHSNINTTMGYTHLLDENQKKMADKIDQIFSI